MDLTSNGKLSKNLSDLFSEISTNSKTPFNYLIKEASSSYSYNLDWWVSCPASRNPHNSNLYIDFCKVQLVNHLLSVGDPINEINVDSKAMHNVLTQISGLDKTKIRHF